LADFSKNVFGNQDSYPAMNKGLNTVIDLMLGDSVKFKLHAPPLIKEKTFKVFAINTYDFESSTDTEFVLRGPSRTTIYMSIENNSDIVEIRLSVRLKHSTVRTLFDENELAEVIDNEDGLVEIHRLVDTDAVGSKLAEYAGWTAPKYYRQAFGVRGYHHKDDFRYKTIPQVKQNCAEFDYYCLVSSDEKHVVEIANYDDSEDVMLTFVTDEQIIEELSRA